jgi:predicted acyl esterase
LGIKNQSNPSVFAYLAAADPHGTVVYITEGELNLSNRKIARAAFTLHSFRRADAEPVTNDTPIDATLTLLPTSVRIPAGWSLRLLIASGDRSTFDTHGDYDADVLPASALTLPVVSDTDGTASRVAAPAFPMSTP